MYPAGIADISVRYVTLPTGVSVRVLESGPANGRPVLLVHGWGSSVYSFSENIPALADGGFRAIAIDLPGHGLSDKPLDEHAYTTASLAAVVVDVATALGVPRFALVGHSMGGALALRIAQTGGSRVERLVLIGAASLGFAPVIGVAKLFSPSLVNRLAPRMLARGVVEAICRVAFRMPGRPTPRDVDEYWAPTQFDEYAWACRALLHRFSFGRVPESALRTLTLPVLAIHGGRDRLVFGGTHRAALIPGARVVEIPEGGHLVMQECSERSNREILGFLGRQLDSQSDK
jgi:pimeloyl-ACP methyl ester carboxylesterase